MLNSVFNDSLDTVKRRKHSYESESCMTDYDILNESKQIFLFQFEPLILGSFLAVPEFPSLLSFVTLVPVEMSGSDHSLARVWNNAELSATKGLIRTACFLLL